MMIMVVMMMIVTGIKEQQQYIQLTLLQHKIEYIPVNNFLLTRSQEQDGQIVDLSFAWFSSRVSSADG